MPLFRYRRWLVLTILMPVTGSVAAQDFSETQRLNNRVLFTRADAAEQKQAAQARHVEELDVRSQQQATLLQQQALAVQQLGSSLQAEKDERRLIEIANAFDAAVVAGVWPTVRSLIADTVAVELASPPYPVQTSVSADAFVADMSRQLTRAVVLPRSNQRAEINDDHATLTSEGFAWTRQGQPRGRPGFYEYRFQRTSQDWLIEAVEFHAAEDR